VKQRLPDLILHVVGSNITPEIGALAAPTVRIHGFVEDLTPMLNSVRLTIAPLRYGAGVKGKVTMSMCHGIPVVGTTVAFEGMALQNGTEMLCGDSAELLAAHIVSAYEDEALWYRLSNGAVTRAQREYSIESNVAQISHFISTVTAADDGDDPATMAPLISIPGSLEEPVTKTSNSLVHVDIDHEASQVMLETRSFDARS
jgi:glycosyltransferase involved in cell wall biosynthesis